MDRTENLQRGIAIAPILFVVAILAVLAIAISAASGAFNGDTSAVKAKAQATAILEYAEQVKMAVDKVYNRGCFDTQISFENPIVSGYTNPNAPSDKSCHVFDVNGGGISFLPIKVSKLETGNDGFFEFQGVNAVAGLGHLTAQLIAFLPLDSLDTCNKINEMVGMKGYLGHDVYGVVRTYDFKGVYGTGAYNTLVNGGGTWIQGKMMGCLKKSSCCPAHHPLYAPYFFFTVLLVR